MSVVTHLNPPSLPANPAFSQAVKVAAPTTLVFIGGQNGVDAAGRVVSDRADEQAAQALRNVEAAVEAAGGALTDIVKWTIVVTDRAALGPGFAAFQGMWGRRPNPPAISVQVVSGLASSDFLVEIEAVAALPG
ncbi:MAG TPA: RidA family protein [Pseudonocardia sp.]|jgi:enamine deaminase RidA (YjgF/YER057c/UK114 family)|nr:RidA family protein [Pseudonocardia sp.]